MFLLLLSFFLILSGLGLMITGALFSTVHIAGAGKWPGIHPGRWDTRLRRWALITTGGLVLALTGFITGYGI